MTHRRGLAVPGEAVLGAIGMSLGSLAGRDLAVCGAEGRLGAHGKAVARARRKRAVTAAVSSTAGNQAARDGPGGRPRGLCPNS